MLKGRFSSFCPAPRLPTACQPGQAQMSQRSLTSSPPRLERTPSAGTDAYRRSAFSVSGAGGQQPDESDALLRDAEGGEASSSPEAQALEQELDVKRQPGLWPRIKRLFGGQNFDRKRLAALGLGAVASYGFVSNATYGTGMAVSWVAFVKRTGQSPLAPGQWKAFLAFFAGFWTLQHFLRPLRFTVAIAMAPAFDRILVFLQKATGWNKRNAFGLYLVLFGSVTSLLFFGAIFAFAGPRAFARA